MTEISDQTEALKIIEKFESLPLERRVEIFSNLTPDGREAILQSISRPQDIVRRISEEEIYFTLKQLGEENAPAVLMFTTGKQLNYIIDLEFWKSDMFNAASAEKWIQIIAGLGEDKLLQMIQVVDPELIVTAMDKMVRVAIRNPDVDLVEEMDHLPIFSFDNTFFIEFKNPDCEDALKLFFETVFNWNHEFYFGLMEELARGISLENEEYARKWRQARLADKGFPEFDEAMEIYKYLHRGAISLEDSTDDSEPHADLSGTVLSYPLKLIFSDNLLRRGLKKISEMTERDRLSSELAHLANKVMVADSKDPASVNSIESSLEKVSGYINLALEEMCNDDETEAARVLRINHMEFLFRRGFSLILDLRKDAHKLLREYTGGIENLGHPLAGLIEGLLQARPYYAGHVVGNDRKREFEKMEDLLRIKEQLDQTRNGEQWEPV